MSKKERVEHLEKQVAALEHRLGVMEDVHAIRRLQHLYGYFIDKCLYREVVDLFAEDGEVRFFGGRFIGKAGAKRLYIDRFQTNFTGGINGPVYGFLLDHPQMQDVVDVADDRKTAKARFRVMMQAGRHELAAGETRQWFEGGLYENDYVKEDGVWKFKILNYAPQWHADFETGWAHTRPNYVPFFDTTYPENPVGPDELIDAWLWPDHKVLPFHCPHPVTGEPVVPEVAAPAQAAE